MVERVPSPDPGSVDAHRTSGRHIDSDRLARNASHAVALMALVNTLARIVLLGSNWILGSLLSQEAFGVNGLMAAVAAFAWVFVGFGLDEVLVQRGAGARFWDATIARASMAVAILTSVVVIALAPILSWVFREPKIIGPLLVLSTAFPLASLSILQMAKTTARMDFRFAAKWSIAELFLTQGMIILFAWLGADAYTFTLPVPIIFALRAIAYRMHVPLERTKPQIGTRRRLLLRKGAMVAGGKFVNCITNQGDYVVLGLLATTTAVGYYFFAFRLAAAPVRTVAVSLNQVLFPAMTTFKGDLMRQSASAVRAATLLAWLIVPLCFYQAAVAEPALMWMFGDKWAPSVTIIQLLAVGLSIEGAMSVTRAYLSAAGKFDVALAYAFGNGVGFIIACIIGAIVGSAFGVAAAVSLFYIFTQPVLFAFLVDRTGQRLYNAYRIFVAPALGSAAAFGAAWYLSGHDWAPRGPIESLFLITLIGWPLCLLAMYLLAPDSLKQLAKLAMGFIRRNRAEHSPSDAKKAGA